jgi:hypothetical protein
MNSSLFFTQVSSFSPHPSSFILRFLGYLL